MDKALDWDSCRSFLAVLEEGSLSGAARKLGLTQPTVGRHVEQLEQTLALPLFVRSQRGLSPTPAAADLRPYAEALKASAEALVRAAAGHRQADAQGVVRITASEVVAVEVLPFILKDLNAAHPRLAFEVEATNRQSDLLGRAADIAIRMTRPAQQALVAVKAGVIEIGLHASADYAARRGLPQSLAELDDHVLIGFDRETSFIRALDAAVALPPRERFILRTDSDLTGLGAVRAGFGIGVCQTGIARREGWIRVLPSFSFPLETWVVMHEDLRANPSCRLTFDGLARGLRAYISG